MALHQAACPGVSQVDVITFDPAPSPPESLAPRARLLRLPAPTGTDDLTALTAALTHHLRHNPIPDILHAHFADGADIARTVGAHYGIPVVYTPHALANDGDDPRRLASELRAIRFAHGIIVSTRDEAERQIPARDPSAITRTYRISPELCALTGKADWTRHAADSVAVYDTLLNPAPPVHPYAQRLLVCDLDDVHTEAAAASVRQLARWTDRAPFPLVISTHHSLPEARALLRRWSLPTPAAILANSGTQIFLNGTAGLHLCAEHDRRLAASWNRDAVHATIASLSPDWQDDLDQIPHRIGLLGGRDLVHRAREALRRAGLAAQVLPTGDGHIDLLPPAAGRTNALAAVAGRYGLTLSDCITALAPTKGDTAHNRCGVALVVSNTNREPAPPSRTKSLLGRLKSFA
ncbi:HAD family hydrolase [Falsirhodobacter sp. 1013]|uniref:HAD family hydrolase n=1 Tax=Falsirhodobacter sp. 1013 TaxID=3417566 RepID=UPI003EB9FBFE